MKKSKREAHEGHHSFHLKVSIAISGIQPQVMPWAVLLSLVRLHFIITEHRGKNVIRALRMNMSRETQCMKPPGCLPDGPYAFT